MKQINPLYAAAFLLTVLFLILFQVSSAKSTQQELLASLEQRGTMATNIQELKENWDNKSKTKKEIQRFLNSAVLKTADIKQGKTNNRIKLSAEKLTNKELNFLLNKLLNGTFTLFQLRIDRVDNTHASFQAEIEV